MTDGSGTSRNTCQTPISIVVHAQQNSPATRANTESPRTCTNPPPAYTDVENQIERPAKGGPGVPRLPLDKAKSIARESLTDRHGGTQRKIGTYNGGVLPLDPAYRDVPMRGKMVFTYGLLFVCLFLMIQSIILGGGFEKLKINPLLGPPGFVLKNMGALHTPSIVVEGQWWRLIWPEFLHGGFVHLFMNLCLWTPIGAMVEPDWGFWRTTLVFLVSAVTGNIFSASLNHDDNASFRVAVGASGGLCGINFALLTYIFEYWSTVMRPKCMLILVFVNAAILMGFSFIPTVDWLMHIGGSIGGLLCGFATLTQCDICSTKYRKKVAARKAAKKAKQQAAIARSNQVSARESKSSSTEKTAAPSVPIPKGSSGKTLATYHPDAGTSGRRWSTVDATISTTRKTRSGSVPARTDRRGSSTKRSSIGGESTFRRMSNTIRERKEENRRLGIRRTSMRITSDPDVDDSYRCGIGVWAIRLASLAGIAALWVPLLMRLYSKDLTQYLDAHAGKI